MHCTYLSYIFGIARATNLDVYPTVSMKERVNCGSSDSGNTGLSCAVTCWRTVSSTLIEIPRIQAASESLAFDALHDFIQAYRKLAVGAYFTYLFLLAMLYFWKLTLPQKVHGMVRRIAAPASLRWCAIAASAASLQCTAPLKHFLSWPSSFLIRKSVSFMSFH